MKKVAIIIGVLLALFILVMIIAIASGGDGETNIENPPAEPPTIENPPAEPPTIETPTEPAANVEPVVATFEPITISGVGSKTTSPFSVTTEEWIIEWSFECQDPEYAMMNIFIYPRGETEIYAEGIPFISEPSGSSYSYAGSGEYYAKIDATNIDSWEVIIKPETPTEPAANVEPVVATFEPITISGVGSKITPPFSVTTEEWIIEWSFECQDPEYAMMNIFIYPRGETEIYAEGIPFISEPSGSSYSYAGSGEYYAKIDAANIDSWEVIIKPAD